MAKSCQFFIHLHRKKKKKKKRQKKRETEIRNRYMAKFVVWTGFLSLYKLKRPKCRPVPASPKSVRAQLQS